MFEVAVDGEKCGTYFLLSLCGVVFEVELSVEPDAEVFDGRCGVPNRLILRSRWKR